LTDWLSFLKRPSAILSVPSGSLSKPNPAARKASFVNEISPEQSRFHKLPNNVDLSSETPVEYTARPKQTKPAVKMPDNKLAVGVPPKTYTLNPVMVPRAPASHGARIQYLQLLHKELTRLSENPQDEAQKQLIIKKCLDLEEEIATKKKEVYKNSIGHLIMRYKKQTPAEYKKETDTAQEQVKMKASTANKTRSGLDNSQNPIITGLTGTVEISRLREFVAKPEQLKKFDYVLEPPTDIEISRARDGLLAADGYETCDRCGQRFQVFPDRRESDGGVATGGTCTFHPGRHFNSRVTVGSITANNWSCCNRPPGFDPGCTTWPTHVFKVTDPKRLAVVLPFVKTPENDSVEGERGLAVDCEMSYTTYGMELVRLTATAFPSGEIVIDALVRPQGVVLDFNTSYSGVTAEMLSSAPLWKPPPDGTCFPDANTTLINPTALLDLENLRQLPVFATTADARSALLKLINKDSVLIGHGLENDLLCLRLCHPTVVDTAILFPHPRGAPIRNKLKFLAERYLKRGIQMADGDGRARGHDSAVDARCAAELVRFKIKEKRRKT
jgi:RNA exonuclease 1